MEMQPRPIKTGRTVSRLSLLCTAALCFHPPCAIAEPSSRGCATGELRLEPRATDPTKRLHTNVEGQDVVIAERVLAAWPIRLGCQIAYTSRDGAGGYENEGQSLWIYDVATYRRRKVLAAYFPIDKVIELHPASGRTALLVEMHDSGLGASHVAVVDPDRGEVFMQRQAKVLSHSNSRLVLGFYEADDWTELIEGKHLAPRRAKSYSVADLLSRPARLRKRTTVP